MIEIKFRITRNWLHKLGFQYKNIEKGVFVDKHKSSDMIEDYKKFLSRIKDLKPYLIEFNKDGSIKIKEYPNNYAMERDICWPVIVIIHDECIFFVNNRIWKV